MNILVINGSPKGEKSDTLKLTRAFLEGMGETAEIVNTVDSKIGNCRACYACWFKTGGRCVINDDAIGIIEKIKAADLLIWSVPLYCYSAPAGCKALMDRTLSANKPAMFIGSDGRAHHYGFEEETTPAVLISSGGLPDVAGNFDGLAFQLRHMYGLNTAAVLCAEAALFMFPQYEPLVEGYKALVRKAGAEYRQNGCISAETQKLLDTPMMPREEYIEHLNNA